jgi:DNA replication and repair protein RecF
VAATSAGALALRIQALVATGVRNLRPLQLEPRARFHVFSGDNGQGKTSLLEAIFVAAALRSSYEPRPAQAMSGTRRSAQGVTGTSRDRYKP